MTCLNKDMQLKNVIESPCGLRFMLDEMELQSGFARRWLLESSMMVDAPEIASSYDMLHKFVQFTSTVEQIHINTLLFKLQGVKDIRTTIKNLSRHAVLDDIEFFEVKHLAILATEVSKLLRNHAMDMVVEIPPLDDVIEILDPDGLKISTFYIYDSYCQQLKNLRATMRKQPERQEELLIEAAQIEEGVRMELSAKLAPYATAIEQAQIAMAQIDVLIAKALQIKNMGLCLPEIGTEGKNCYQDMFHPQVKDALAVKGRKFQLITIATGMDTTLITGANMGGKTVVLKTLTLCQLLFQFGFGIPATKAVISPKDEIYFCIGDDQSIEKGLSSFAAEMKNIDAVIKASREDRKILALIDEPARTTNPTEGAALVQALLKVLSGNNVGLVMTTHYDIEPGSAHCLRVKGFENGLMNYTLVEVHDGEVPHEALNIAQSLGIDSEWIDEARHLLTMTHQIKPN